MDKTNTQEKKRASSAGYIIRKILFILIFLTGFVILMYPTFSNVWNEYRNSLLRTGYTEAVVKLDTDTYDKIWAEARAYNAQHTVNNIVDAFDEEKDEYVLSHPYDQMLNPTGNDIMGHLSIPKIHVNLAIFHGLGSEALEEGCGHVEGTSLPIGGVGTHAALAAHRGLPSAKLFTDADQLVKGDLFFITVLDETLAYEVDQIKTVEPSQVEDLAIDEKEDYVTLITCTPYGVNTHRLLIRGKRTEYVEEEVKQETLLEEVIAANPYLKLLVIGLAVFILFMILTNMKEKKKRKG